MLKIPDKSEFGGKGKPAVEDDAKPISEFDEIQRLRQLPFDWFARPCARFRQNVPFPWASSAIPRKRGFAASSRDRAASHVCNTLMKELGGVPIKYFADWTDRIAKGELPHAKPPRPQGVERNIVVTTWDWLDDKHYLHDLIASDRRFPTVNAYGPLYGSTEFSVDVIPILDPKTHTAKNFPAPVRDANTPPAFRDKPMQSSPYWGEEQVWKSKANNHNGMFDRKGRVWFAAAVRGPDNPAFCKKGSDHPSAKAFPTERTNRHLTMLDPKTMKYTFVDTCFGTHHLQFDAHDRLWTSGGGQVLGWLDMKIFDETGDAAKAQGWTPMILDTNGNGKRDAYVEPNQPVDPTKDKRIVGRLLRGHAKSRGWLGLGFGSDISWSRSRGSRLDQIPRKRRSRKSTIFLCPALVFVAPISISRAWYGRRWPAAISPASIGANAKVRSTVRKRWAIIAPKAGRSSNIPVPAFRASETIARSRVITPGLISTIRSVLVRMCRCPRQICITA